MRAMWTILIQKYQTGTTPLIAAAYSRSATAVCMLLEAGADSEIKDGFRQTAMDIAILRGDSTIMELLLENSSKKKT